MGMLGNPRNETHLIVGFFGVVTDLDDRLRQAFSLEHLTSSIFH